MNLLMTYDQISVEPEKERVKKGGSEGERERVREIDGERERERE